jgi:hypothetical protein
MSPDGWPSLACLSSNGRLQQSVVSQICCLRLTWRPGDLAQEESLCGGLLMFMADAVESCVLCGLGELSESRVSHKRHQVRKEHKDFCFTQSRQERKATVLKVKREPPQSAQIFAAHATPSDV